MLTNEYPYSKYPKANWTKVVRYFCEEWANQGHRVVAIVNSSRFPRILYFVAKIGKKFISSFKDINTDGLEDTSWNTPFEFEENKVRVLNRPMFKLLPGGKYSNREIQRQVNNISLSTVI